MICRLQKPARTVQVAHILLLVKRKEAASSPQMGNSEGPDETIGKTGSGSKQ